MKEMNVLLVGSGGREHALAWKLRQSPLLKNLYIAPGNGGTESLGTNLAIQADDFEGIVNAVEEYQIDLVVVGPDDPLANGIVDYLQSRRIPVFGPTKKAARIESSKSFAKSLMQAQKIPTAAYATFDKHTEAMSYIQSQQFPLVVKASGLALGKGVYICQEPEEAEQALNEIMLDQRFGQAGNEVVIEQHLTGDEVSIHAFCDGNTAKLFPTTQDHKRAYDNDEGPNTGGMGVITPVPWVSQAFLDRVASEVVQPTLEGLRKTGSPFTGCLYPGLMVDGDDLNVLEFNARFGDPETQVYMRLLQKDLLEILLACTSGTLDSLDITWSNESAICAVLASGGYPSKYASGIKISGLEEAESIPGVEVFHAGTKRVNGEYVTAGGRVLNVTATGSSLQQARERAYQAVELIHFEGMHYRKDIGSKSL